MLGIDAQTWGVAANIATVIGVAAAVLAALGAFIQVTSQRAIQREVNAKQIYANFLRLAFDHPDYAEPKRPVHEDSDHSMRYVWFVTMVLNAMEEILLITKEDEWRKAVDVNLAYHVNYLRTSQFMEDEFPTYGPELRALIKKAISKAEGSNNPKVALRSS